MSVTVASLVLIVTSRSVVFFLAFSAYNDAEFVSVAWQSRSVPARVRACAVEIGPSIRFLPIILSREMLLSRYSITLVLTYLPITIFTIGRCANIGRKIGDIVRPEYQPFRFRVSSNSRASNNSENRCFVVMELQTIGTIGRLIQRREC